MGLQEMGSGRLTKSFLMGLGPGDYLVSGVGLSPTRPFFAEHVTPLSERGEQWERIRAVEVDQRNCAVFASREDWEASAAELASRTHGLPSELTALDGAPSSTQRDAPSAPTGSDSPRTGAACPQDAASAPLCFLVRLTKQALMKLEEGLYMTSNTVHPLTGRARFAEYVAPPQDREAQWRRIRLAGVDQSTATLYVDKGNYEVSLTRILMSPSGRRAFPGAAAAHLAALPGHSADAATPGRPSEASDTTRETASSEAPDVTGEQRDQQATTGVHGCR